MSNFNDSFQTHLNAFEEIIKDYPEIGKAKKDLSELRQSSINDNEMTFHQKSAIQSRVDNYISGQYGDQVKKVDNRSEYSKKLV